MGPRRRRVRRVGFACKDEGTEVGWVRDKRMCGRVREPEREGETKRGQVEESRSGEYTAGQERGAREGEAQEGEK